MDWKTFQKHFCDSDASDCHQRVETLLSYSKSLPSLTSKTIKRDKYNILTKLAMMRRTMKTTILNRPIIVLPKPHPEIQYINFSTEERVIYRIVCFPVSFFPVLIFLSRQRTDIEQTSIHTSKEQQRARRTEYIIHSSFFYFASDNVHPIHSCWNRPSKSHGILRIWKSCVLILEDAKRIGHHSTSNARFGYPKVRQNVELPRRLESVGKMFRSHSR